MLPLPKIDYIEAKFSLSEPVPILKIDSVDGLKFITLQKEGKEYLTGIHFVVSTQELVGAESFGLRMARLLCNLISYKCKKGIIPIYKGHRIKYIDGRSANAITMPFKIWRDNDLELSADEIKEVEKNPNQLMFKHFSTSFIALLKYDDHVTVIKELYQILEDTNTFPPILKKYKYLRHALSHSSPLRQDTLRNIEKKFGQNYFVFNKKQFDYDHPTNIRNLSIESWKFMEEMWNIFGVKK